MKIYIGSRTINDQSYRSITEPQILNHIVDDSEATVIILDGVLRKHTLQNAVEILKLCRKKIRVNGIIKIIDIDFDLLVYTYRKLGNILELNNAVFFQSEMRSFINLETLNGIVSELGEMILIGSNINNIEFDLEFKRV